MGNLPTKTCGLCRATFQSRLNVICRKCHMYILDLDRKYASRLPIRSIKPS